ncbi:hypothetical protein LWF01_02365 [Saxibacter everestensis]|uniref:LXG domain-containing protein n=1 Tax=Saxibacter everestensis TaxID=2909229 RepID=A0ABY8QUN8_9MICO|nr:hypothetical protein LWF01_02365 [Brevibacteriaceae bacterium ZFBP1038]
MATTLGGVATSSRTQFVTAVGALTGPRAQELSSLSTVIVDRIDAASLNAGSAAGYLGAYGIVLEAAKRDMPDLKSEWLTLQKTANPGESGMCTPDNPSGEAVDPALVSQAQQRQKELERQAANIVTNLDASAKSSSTSLNGISNSVVPNAAGMSPDDALRKVLGVVAGIDPAVAANASWTVLKTGGKYAKMARDLYKLPSKVRNAKALIDGYKSVRAAREVLAEAQATNRGVLKTISTIIYRNENAAKSVGAGRYLTAQDLLKGKKLDLTAKTIQVKAPWVTPDGKPMSASEYRNWVKANPGAADDIKPIQTTAGRFIDSAKWSSKYAKGLGVISLGSNLQTAITGSQYGTGARGTADRLFAGAGVATGTASLLATAGLITLGPVGAGIILVVGVVSLAWSVGNLIYDNRKAIGEGIQKAGEGIKKAGEWVGEKAKKLWPF